MVDGTGDEGNEGVEIPGPYIDENGEEMAVCSGDDVSGGKNLFPTTPFIAEINSGYEGGSKEEETGQRCTGVPVLIVITK
jgi:hypothetical protein